MSEIETYDVVVVGGGPAGATAANDLARKGLSVLLLDRGGRIKPCGGAIPPQVMKDFAIPETLLVARATAARMVAPSAREVDMPIEGGYVGLVDRETFDEWLRARAALAGATRRTGQFEGLEQQPDGLAVVRYERAGRDGPIAESVRARVVVGADGAKSAVARAALPDTRTKYVFAYHEIIRSPAADGAPFDGGRCDIHYNAQVSPDFYGWVFPHGDTISVGVGSAQKGFSLRKACGALRATVGLDGMQTIRREGAPIPLKPLRRWDNRRNVVLAGDAAGVVAPASGEGIYYAMTGGRFAAEAADAFCRTGDVRALATARARFMKAHGRVFWILGIMQYFWYSSDKRREKFVSICRDRDVQRLTWEAYMYKKLVKANHAAHFKIFLKDMGHLLGFAST